MNTRCIRQWIGGLSVIVLLGWTSLGFAQTFVSGSTGADGAFTPAANTTVTLPPSGVFNYTTVNIPAGVTVTYTPNAANTPVTVLATGNVTIAGILSVNGTNGANGSTTGPLVNPGALGGPGGFNGGQGGSRDGTLAASSGHGPGGGAVTPANAVSGSYGVPVDFVSLLPLFGGSGGAGVIATGGGLSGPSGAGGGGAVVIASSTLISVSGTIRANGGDAGTGFLGAAGGVGSGGAIRLVAPQISGAGSLLVNAGIGGVVGGRGNIRLEAFTLGFSGTTTFAALSTSLSPGPVTAASTPALINLPTLTISSVGSTGAPAIPGGSYTTADIALPAGTANPVPVTLTVTNIPVGTVFSVVLRPPAGNATTVTVGSSGTFAVATATTNVSFPLGQVSVLNAFGSFTLPLLASLFIDGEAVDRVMVAANFGESSSLSLVTTSGKEMPVSQLSQEDQLKVAMAFEVMRNTK